MADANLWGTETNSLSPADSLYVATPEGNTAMQVTWTKGFELDTANLESVKTNGVYVIYQTGNPPSTIYVGKGEVSKRLSEHKTDKRFDGARRAGKLFVTFAEIPAQSQEGVEKHLARLFAPKIGERHPEAVQEIAVNSPFAA